MEEQATTTLRDALRNVAGISIAAGEGGFQGDSLTLRGFSARNDIYVDGMRDFGSYYRDPFHLQQVEVLKGPSSAGFGRGSTGGVVNQSTRLPTLEPTLDAELSFGTAEAYRVTANVNQPIGSGRGVRDLRDGQPESRRGTRHHRESPLGSCALDRVRPRRRDAADAGVLPPHGGRHSRLRRALVLRRARAGRPLQLLRLRGGVLPRHGRRHGHDSPDPRVFAEHLDPRPGALRPLHARRTNLRRPAALLRDPGDAARADPGEPQSDRGREHGDLPPEPARRDAQVQDGQPGPHARLRNRGRPRDVRPDPSPVQRRTDDEPPAPGSSRRVRGNRVDLLARRRHFQHLRGVRARHGRDRQVPADGGSPVGPLRHGVQADGPDADRASPAWTRC